MCGMRQTLSASTGSFTHTRPQLTLGRERVTSAAGKADTLIHDAAARPGIVPATP